MSTWEARMALRAAARERARLEAEPEPEMPPGHEGHHMHLRGTAVECSCGEFYGITCVVIDFDAPEPVCPVCGARGVAAAGK